MKRLLTLSVLMISTLPPAALAGNTSSNSSSNSSNGVHTRVDTIVTEDGRRRTVYERRIVRERAPYRYDTKRHRRSADEDED